MTPFVMPNMTTLSFGFGQVYVRNPLHHWFDHIVQTKIATDHCLSTTSKDGKAVCSIITVSLRASSVFFAFSWSTHGVLHYQEYSERFIFGI